MSDLHVPRLNLFTLKTGNTQPPPVTPHNTYNPLNPYGSNFTSHIPSRPISMEPRFGYYYDEPVSMKPGASYGSFYDRYDALESISSPAVQTLQILEEGNIIRERILQRQLAAQREESFRGYHEYPFQVKLTAPNSYLPSPVRQQQPFGSSLKESNRTIISKNPYLVGDAKKLDNSKKQASKWEHKIEVVSQNQQHVREKPKDTPKQTPKDVPSVPREQAQSNLSSPSLQVPKQATINIPRESNRQGPKKIPVTQVCTQTSSEALIVPLMSKEDFDRILKEQLARFDLMVNGAESQDPLVDLNPLILGRQRYLEESNQILHKIIQLTSDSKKGSEPKAINEIHWPNC